MLFFLKAGLVLSFFSLSLMAFDLKAYSELQGLLASDKVDEAKAKVTSYLHQENAKSSISSALEKLRNASDELTVRKSFGELSEQWVEKLKKDKTLQDQWQLFFCPMTPKGVYGYWLQPKNTDLRNPYFGAKMLTCGVKRKW